MGLLGIFGKYGAYRLANSLAILDTILRGVDPKDAKGARKWSNYTWHGDQAPGQPWVHGLQASDCDFNDLRFSRLIIMDGKNLVENKMTDSPLVRRVHGARGEGRRDHAGIRRPRHESRRLDPDPSVDRRGALPWHHEDHDGRRVVQGRFRQGLHRFPTLPADRRPDAPARQGSLPQLSVADLRRGASFKVQNLTKEQHQKLGDFVVWDRKTNAPAAVTRDDVGKRLAAAGIDPELDKRCELTLADGKKVECVTVWAAYRKHLEDYDLETVHQITQTPKEQIVRLAKDIANFFPVAIHQGKGSTTGSTRPR